VFSRGRQFFFEKINIICLGVAGEWASVIRSIRLMLTRRGVLSLDDAETLVGV